MNGLLDIRTLSFITVLFCYVFGISLFTFHKTLKQFDQTDFDGIPIIAVGQIFIGNGFLLLSLRNYISDFLSVVAANSFVFIGIVLITEGLFRFRQQHGRLRLVGPTLLLILFLLFVFYTHLKPNINARVVVAGLCFSMQFSICALLLFKNRSPSLKIPAFVTGVPMALAAFFFGFRAVWAVGERPLQDFMNAGTVHALAFIVLQIVVIVLSFGVVWMVNSTLQEKLESLARIDPLTKVFNRRGLEEMGLRVMAQNRRDETPFSVLLIDIDYFKKINDTYGHQAGDMILSQFAALLKEHLRLNDTLARYGGEEFVVVMSNTESNAAFQTAEKFRKLLQSHQFFAAKQQKIQVTASFGICTVERVDHRTHWEAIIEQSDTALYQAKQQGRNRVCSFGRRSRSQ